MPRTFSNWNFFPVFSLSPAPHNWRQEKKRGQFAIKKHAKKEIICVSDYNEEASLYSFFYYFCHHPENAWEIHVSTLPPSLLLQTTQAIKRRRKIVYKQERTLFLILRLFPPNESELCECTFPPKKSFPILFVPKRFWADGLLSASEVLKRRIKKDFSLSLMSDWRKKEKLLLLLHHTTTTTTTATSKTKKQQIYISWGFFVWYEFM